MTQRLQVNVTGTPAPQGSKKGFYNKNLGRVQMTESSNKVAPWRQDVVAAVLNEMAEATWSVPPGPVAVGVEFRLARPKYHFRTGARAHELRPEAPYYVDKKPDLDKLLRSTLDALTTSGAIRDDAQVALLDPAPVKRYAAPGESTGALIVISPLNPVPAPALILPPPGAGTAPQSPVVASTALGTADATTDQGGPAVNFHTEEMPLLTIQEQRAADAPRIYRPHTATKPKTFDWDALTPTCTECGSKTGQVNTFSGLCPACDPTITIATAQRAVTAPRRTPSGRRLQGPRIEVDVAAIIEAYAGGQSVSGIATALRVKPYRVTEVLDLAGIERRNDQGRGGRPRTRPAREPRPRRAFDIDAIIEAYRDGATAPAIAREHSCTPSQIRKILDLNGVPRRDDRATASGGQKLVRDPELIAKIRRLYLDEHLSQADVARRLHTSTKVIWSIMTAENIPAREGQGGRGDGAAPLKARIAELGVPVYDIKCWAIREGLLMEMAPGIPPGRVVDAYVAAHPAEHRQDGAA